MTRTHEEGLYEAIDKIIKDTKDANIRILAVRLKKDREFCLSFLQFTTELSLFYPYFLDELNKQYNHFIGKGIYGQDSND